MADIESQIRTQEEILAGVIKSRDEETDPDYRTDLNNRVDRLYSVIARLKREAAHDAGKEQK